MDRIIRSKAVETSNQSHHSDTSALNLHLSFEMTAINGGSVASTSTALPEAPTKTSLATVKVRNKAIQNTSNWSTSLQVLLHQPPSILPYLVLLSSIAFFATVVVWAWIQKIEQVGHLQGKFVSIGELHQLYQQDLSSVFSSSIHHVRETRSETADQDIPLVLIATLPHQVAGFLNKEDKVEIKLDGARNWNESLISGRVISIVRDNHFDEQMGLTDRVTVALDRDNFTKNKQAIKILVGQTITAKIIHQSRIADILLQSIKHLQQS